MNICEKITLNNSRSPWKRLSSKKIYDNPWICIDEDQVINPSGNLGIYGKVQMKNLAIGIIPIDQDSNTWLVGQYRYMLDQYSWEIPMGGCPQGELPEEAALRELKEETGLVANRLTRIQEIHTSNSVTNELGIVFLAESLEQKNAELEETEDITTVKIPLIEAIQMAYENKITDSISVSGLLKAAILKNTELTTAKK